MLFSGVVFPLHARDLRMGGSEFSKGGEMLSLNLPPYATRGVLA